MHRRRPKYILEYIGVVYWYKMWHAHLYWIGCFRNSRKKWVLLLSICVSIFWHSKITLTHQQCVQLLRCCFSISSRHFLSKHGFSREQRDHNNQSDRVFDTKDKKGYSEEKNVGRKCPTALLDGYGQSEESHQFLLIAVWQKQFPKDSPQPFHAQNINKYGSIDAHTSWKLGEAGFFTSKH